MSPAQNSRLMVEAAVLHEMADRLHAVLVAPVGHAAVHRAAPGFGEGVEILVPRGDLLLAGQLELVGDVGLFPIDLPLGQHAVQFGAPVAAGFRLVVEEAEDRLAEIGLEMVVVRLIDRLEEPIDAILARAVDAQLPVLAEGRRLHVGELHDLPLARRALARRACRRGCAGRDRRGCRRRSCRRPSRGRPGRRRSARRRSRRPRTSRGPSTSVGGGFEPLRRIARRHLAGDALAGPPLLVEDPHLEIVLLRRIQADRQIAKPALAEPVVVRARFGGEACRCPLRPPCSTYISSRSLLSSPCSQNSGPVSRFASIGSSRNWRSSDAPSLFRPECGIPRSKSQEPQTDCRNDDRTFHGMVLDCGLRGMAGKPSFSIEAGNGCPDAIVADWAGRKKYGWRRDDI